MDNTGRGEDVPGIRPSRPAALAARAAIFRAPAETAVLPSSKKWFSEMGTLAPAGATRPLAEAERLNDTPDGPKRRRPPRFLYAVIDLQRALRDRRRYRRQIEHLFDRTLFDPARRALRQDGVGLETVFDHQRRVAGLLARAVGSHQYELAPGKVREILVDGKVRDVFTFGLTDLLVHGVVAEIVGEASGRLLSPRLFSYRRGLSWQEAVSEFAALIRQHRRERPDPRGRGLYVMRRDIDSYTDSIPVFPGAPLWTMLADLFRTNPAGGSPVGWDILEAVIRPLVFSKDGGLMNLVRGVPTGQPISCVVFNFYLHELDHELAGIPGGFYARYSDDIIFAHPNPDAVDEAIRAAERRVGTLGLKFKPAKSLDIFLTGAGRPSPVRPGARGRGSVPLLGTEVWADGTISLDRDKSRALLRDLEDRATRAARCLRGRPVPVVGRAVCAVINRALHPEAKILRQRSADIVWRILTNRPQLRHLDGLIARLAVRAVTGDAGAKAFRRIPYRVVREDWGLASLFHGRDRKREGRR